MIESFKHRGLKRLYDHGDVSKVHPDQLSRIEDVLFQLDSAKTPGDLGLPGYRLHPLKGDMKGYWSVTISGNWRIIFRFVKGGAYDVDLVDYH
jgi:proteic killer suppression protein